ncbi:MAG TPA: D-alanyl-D-alanine carboxypeptidase family protein, partial [Candidatus Saccharimonadales bacterium]|nr:D-alanyl-D-alanine carboxypeptidase family protein [Candidatus Saccharimonadales bacterium]
GTIDRKDHDGWHDGKKVRIKICEIKEIKSSGRESQNVGFSGATGGILVNSRVSGAYLALAKRAENNRGPNGQAQPLTLQANSSYRTMANQERLWDELGHNTALVARPGHSNHQMGIAIDFAKSNGSALTSGDQWFKFLKDNADLGIINYPREAWHWSPTGN